MNKEEFLRSLRNGLAGLPQDEIDERLTFYSEMIDDRIEDGLTQEDAIYKIGSVEDIVSQIMEEIPLSKLVKERVKPKRTLRAWEVVLLVLGSPIWLSLLIAAFAVILSLYIVLWAVIIALWGVFVSVAACAFGAMVAGIVFALKGNALTGIAMLSAGMVCAGLSILLFYGCKAATKGILLLTKKIAIWIKNRFVKRG